MAFVTEVGPSHREYEPSLRTGTLRCLRFGGGSGADIPPCQNGGVSDTQSHGHEARRSETPTFLSSCNATSSTSLFKATHLKTSMATSGTWKGKNGEVNKNAKTERLRRKTVNEEAALLPQGASLHAAAPHAAVPCRARLRLRAAASRVAAPCRARFRLHARRIATRRAAGG